ncbi:MAG TPA: Ig-like domain-containing protein [Longimicrobiaceae bacterium]|nr:Ig-like domain-containing protein [Longimicrobiaceae bacterium]
MRTIARGAGRALGVVGLGISILAGCSDGGVSGPEVRTPDEVRRLGGEVLVGEVGAELAAPLEVQVMGKQKPVGGVWVRWRVAQGEATLAADSTFTDEQGFARVRARMPRTAQEIRVEATTGALPPAAFALRSVYPCPDAGGVQLQRVGSRPIGGIPGDTLAQEIRVRATCNGAPLPNLLVRWTVGSGPAALVTDTSVTSSSGIASARLVLGASTGDVSLRAELAGVAPVLLPVRVYPPCEAFHGIAPGDTIQVRLRTTGCDRDPGVWNRRYAAVRVHVPVQRWGSLRVVGIAGDTRLELWDRDETRLLARSRQDNLYGTDPTLYFIFPAGEYVLRVSSTTPHVSTIGWSSTPPSACAWAHPVTWLHHPMATTTLQFGPTDCHFFSTETPYQAYAIHLRAGERVWFRLHARELSTGVVLDHVELTGMMQNTIERVGEFWLPKGTETLFQFVARGEGMYRFDMRSRLPDRYGSYEVSFTR